MSGPRVYSLPLLHGDSGEYMRVRRSIETVSRRGEIAVAYEFPNNDASRSFMRDVLGRSGRTLGSDMESFMAQMQVNEDYAENVMSNMFELDRAKHQGLVTAIYPIDIDHTTGKLVGRKEGFILKAIAETRAMAKLTDAIIGFSLFPEVVSLVREVALARKDAIDLRNTEMNEQVGIILGADDRSRLVLMTGALHVPGLKKLLRADGTAVVQLEDPKNVAGIWWLAHTATQEALRLKGNNGESLNKYALLLSIITLKAAKAPGDLTGEDIQTINGVRSSAEASLRYEEAQRYYRCGFDNSIPILVRK